MMTAERIRAIRYSALTIVLSVAAPLERGYCMNGQSLASEAKTILHVTPYWSSLTDPHDEEFELPLGITSCSILKVRAKSEITMVDSRLGRYAVGGTFVIEDNFGDDQYSNGQIIEARFHRLYNGISFNMKPETQILSPNRRTFFLDRHNSNVILSIDGGGPTPTQNQPSYVCATKSGYNIIIAYFLKRAAQT